MECSDFVAARPAIEAGEGAKDKLSTITVLIVVMPYQTSELG
jgi:hypothetical protein